MVIPRLSWKTSISYLLVSMAYQGPSGRIFSPRFLDSLKTRFFSHCTVRVSLHGLDRLKFPRPEYNTIASFHCSSLQFLNTVSQLHQFCNLRRSGRRSFNSRTVLRLDFHETHDLEQRNSRARNAFNCTYSIYNPPLCRRLNCGYRLPTPMAMGSHRYTRVFLLFLTLSL